MANLDSFFNKSVIDVTAMASDLSVESGVEFTLPLDIIDRIKGNTVTSVAGTFTVASGRNVTELSDVPAFTAPTAQPVDPDEGFDNPMWPVSAWTLTATIADAAWTSKLDLTLNLKITDIDGVVHSHSLVIYSGE